MGRPRRPAKRRARERATGGRGGKRGGRRGARLDPERIVGMLAARGRQGLPATKLLRALGGARAELRPLRRVLQGLEAEGRVERVRGGWRVPRKDGLREGELAAQGSGNAGSVRDDAGREWRVGDTLSAKVGDRVLLAPGARGRGVLLDVVDAARENWVGIFTRRGKRAGLVPYRDEGDWWVGIAPRDCGRAREGEVVVAEPVASRSGRHATPRARVVECLGRPGDANADFEALVWRHRLPREFPEDVLAELEELGDQGPPEESPRSDLRDLPFVTIDPASARDHDDAVCVETADGNGFLLEVAIADVAHWVRAGGAIDREAQRRGNSVYFPDRAIPMLPERLSGDLCSLRPDVDRRVISVGLRFDARGEPVGRPRIRPAWIRSRAKLSYGRAAAAIEGGDASAPQAAMLRDLAGLARRLRERRQAGGSLDFELPSPSFRFDARGHPIDVRASERNWAHRAIEEAMLAANRALAEWLFDAEVPAVYRVHDAPSARDIERLGGELVALGLIDGGALDALPAAELARALQRAVGSPAERWIHQLALRSMQRARYGAKSRPHYALGFEHYLHFTSPIRRYADLAVHRALRAQLAAAAPALGRGLAEAVAQRASYRERVAVAAEREMDQLKACVLLRDHRGECHEGSVTGLARHGVYVTLDAWWVEGLVHVSRLSGYFELDESGRSLRSDRQRYELGDRLSVRIVDADPRSARIDFALDDGRRRPRERG